MSGATAGERWQPVPGITSVWLLNYDVALYGFAEYLARYVFRVDDLSRLHVAWARHKGGPLEYRDNLELRRVLQRLPPGSGFYRIYERFHRRLVAPLFGGRISYSSAPKMRVHLAGTGSVSLWHRDADITGRPEQINIWLPVTDSFGTNCLWVESDYGRGDHQPVPVRYGQALFFDGGFLSHGTVRNDTDTTRISFDMRFAPLQSRAQELVARFLGHRPPGIEATMAPGAGRQAAAGGASMHGE
ncbi:streptomycin biosynthesis enzyme StrG [Sorangium sp. So ce1000]|uniref:streptomycin biosynthesis enzyme StrG n=1 Tax=Sorangium sp. So ce1000 TaxID=3133325 RepID=UPI003F6310E9